MSTTSIHDTVHSISVNDIHVSRYNVRKELSDENIAELRENIKKYGQLQPVLLLGVYGKPPYELIVGQRRFEAIKKIPGKEVLSVFNNKLSPIDAIVVSLAENLQRSNLTFEDMSNAITRIYDHYKKVSTVAKTLNITAPTVYEYLKVERAITPRIKEYITANKISKEDLKRAIKIARGDENKILHSLKEITKLPKSAKDRAIEISEEEPDASAHDIFEKARKPRISNTIVLSLSNEINDALEEAKSKLKEDKETIALKAIRTWLLENGFIQR